MNMVLGVATRGWDGWNECVRSWNETASKPYRVYCVAGMKVVPAYQTIYEDTTEEIIAFLHDDLVIHEVGWDLRVLKEFEDESVGMVGFGCGRGHGRPELYKVPYRLQDLARQDFISNMDDAEMHGRRFKGECDVAVCDGFAVFVRRLILDTWDIGNFYHFGFPQNVPVGYFMWAENLACEVRRQGKRIRCVGVSCKHIGGRTSVRGVTENYEQEHEYFYEHNRDVMPYYAK